MPGARQKLSQILSSRFKDRNLSDTYVSCRCKVSIQTVEGWRKGSLVPNTGEWADLLQYIERDFYMHNSLWREAKAEEDEERRDTIRALDRAQRIEGSEVPKIGTNIGEKIKEASSSKSPPPTPAMRQLGQVPKGYASDGRLLCPDRPMGSMSTEAQQDRRRFVKGLLLQRPFIRIGGEDGIQAQLRARFGIGIDPKIIPQLREEIAKDTKSNYSTISKIVEKPVANIPVKSATEKSVPKDLQEAVELIVGVIPDFQQLVITKNEAGEVDVEFKIRTVVEGSLKIPRAAK